MQIPEPRLSADLEDDNDARDDRCWHGDALRLLARQLGVGNDFYFPLLGAAMLIDGRTLVRYGSREREIDTSADWQTEQK